VDHCDVVEIQVHGSPCGFAGFFIPKITQSAGWALVDLLDDAIGRGAVHIDPRAGLDVKNFAEALDTLRGVDAQPGFPDHGYFSVRISLVGIAHGHLQVTGKVYQGFLKLRVGGVGRLVVEEAREFGVVNDDRGIALNGVEVFFLEGVAGFRGDEHLPGKRDGSAGVFRGNGLLGSESFVDAHDKFGDIVQPGELRVVDDQAEKLAGVDVAVLAFVVAALHVEERLVELEER
jgi:hypothetical protein